MRPTAAPSEQRIVLDVSIYSGSTFPTGAIYRVTATRWVCAFRILYVPSTIELD